VLACVVVRRSVSLAPMMAMMMLGARGMCGACNGHGQKHRHGCQ